ncbi:PEPxxWA-CTERM sorting domain-containing protein [Sphingomonas sp. AP4-R1]|nr:PEPxxWA-CTERM sorting domain-containing protein [Sphingomonas sp. AP4-R1]
MRCVKSAVLATALLGLSTAASAATLFNFTFTVPWSILSGGGTATGSGQFYANDLGNGTFSVYDADGTAKVTAASTAAVLDTTSTVLLQSAPTISYSASTGYTINAVTISGPSTSYTFTKDLLDSNYAISNGLRGGTGSLNIALAPIAAVPEVATWAMMILGFGMIGVVLRNSKRPSGFHA